MLKIPHRTDHLEEFVGLSHDGGLNLVTGETPGPAYLSELSRARAFKQRFEGLNKSIGGFYISDADGLHQIDDTATTKKPQVRCLQTILWYRGRMKSIPLSLHVMSETLGRRWSLYRKSTTDKLLSGSLYAWTQHVLFDLNIGEGDGAEVSITIAAGPYISLHVPIPYALQERLCAIVLRGIPHQSYSGADVIRVSIHDGAVYWSLLHTSDEWSSKTPRWRSGSFDLVDALLGESEQEERLLRTEDVEIPLSEGTYKWRVQLFERVTSRPRWPGSKKTYG